MKNPIIENRIVIDYTFATRLLKHLKSEHDNLLDPKQNLSMIDYATKLLKYQCLNTTEESELLYLKRTNTDFHELVKPDMVTEDKFKIYFEQHEYVYSCMKKPTVGDQILHINDMAKHLVKSDRVYFGDLDNCRRYLDHNKPLFSIDEINAIFSEKSYEEMTVMKSLIDKKLRNG